MPVPPARGDGPLVFVGECMAEVAPSDAAPGAYGLGFAGDAFNAAWACRALAPDAPVRFLSAIGNDRISAELTAFVAGAGIDTAFLRAIPGRSIGLYLVMLDAGERSFSYWRGQSAARSLADDPAVLAAGLAGARLVHVTGITLAILDPDGRDRLLAALAAAREAGACIVFDPNHRPRLWDSPATAAASYARAYALADFALPTLDDEALLGGPADAHELAVRLLAAGCTEVVVKDGSRPCLVAANGDRTLVPVGAAVTPVDTTGAGDAFGAAYVAARLGGHAPVDAAAAAHRVAAAVVGCRGALAPPDVLRAPFPPPAEVRRRLNFPAAGSSSLRMTKDPAWTAFSALAQFRVDGLRPPTDSLCLDDGTGLSGGLRGAHDLSGASWRIAGAALRDRRTLEAVLAGSGEAHAGAPARAVTSRWMRDYVEKLVPAVVIADVAFGLALPVALGEIGLLLDARAVPTGFVLAHGGEAAAADPFDAFFPLLRGHLDPLVTVLARHGRAPPRVLWSEVAVRLDAVLGALEAVPAHADRARDRRHLLLRRQWPDGWRNRLFDPVVRLSAGAPAAAAPGGGSAASATSFPAPRTARNARICAAAPLRRTSDRGPGIKLDYFSHVL
ncbi:siderophore-iron reductase FhuF [Methylobrevis pamukkalensis]|uniref:2-dehydro-3-deoxygluconokinase n=1 Tax=Methylobrevis pamukkalensis TaxID=1439726 RepID=A0A1E3GZ81_9HYPH|nr:siderophore-iron reductase FhuF [Methylobrevis pamukkalensis]ODN69377.1 2-dehydro-3-deoxygluconokinase [Methylobrevis pamukkalensis]